MKEVLITVFLAISTIANCQKIDLYEDLLFELRFNGDISDSGPFSQEGVIHGDVSFTYDRFGKKESACMFDGNMDFIIFPENDLMDFGHSDFTISLWFKTEFSGTQMILMKGNDSITYAQYWIRLNSDWDNNALTFLTGDNYPPSSSVNYKSGERISDNIWHHVVARRDGEFLSLFYDGNLEARVSQTIENVNNDYEMIIGAQFPRAQYYYHNFFNGILDDIRIYSRALNDCEIESLFSGSFPAER